MAGKQRITIEWLRERAQDALGQEIHGGHLVQVREHDHELVSTQARDRIVGLDGDAGRTHSLTKLGLHPLLPIIILMLSHIIA